MRPRGRRPARRRSRPRPYVMAPWRAASSAQTGSSAHSTFGPVDLGDVRVEALQQGVERAVVLEEVELDVEQDRPGERQLEVGAVALVGLDDEHVAARPVGAGAGVRDVAADDEARRQTRPRRGSASASTSSSSCRACRRRRSSGPGRRSRPASRPGAASGCPARGRRRARCCGPGSPSTTSPRRTRRRCRRRGRRCTTTPAARTRSSTGWSRKSLPDTVWPISARAMAIADMPGPPTPTTCRRRGRERSIGARGAASGGTAVTVAQARGAAQRQPGIVPARPRRRRRAHGSGARRPR